VADQWGRHSSTGVPEEEGLGEEVGARAGSKKRKAVLCGGTGRMRKTAVCSVTGR